MIHAVIEIYFIASTVVYALQLSERSNWTAIFLHLPFSTTVALAVIWHRWLLCVPLFTIRIYFGVYVKLSCLPMFVRALLCQFIWLHHSSVWKPIPPSTLQFIIIVLSLLGKVFWFASIWIFTHTASNIASSAPHSVLWRRTHLIYFLFLPHLNVNKLSVFDMLFLYSSHYFTFSCLLLPLLTEFVGQTA